MINKDLELIKLGKRIRVLRCTKDLTQEQLAAKAGLDTSYISQLENGQRNPTYIYLLSLADALNVTLVELFFFDN